MKHLYLIRHAKASWDNPDQTDFDRPLAKQGETDAHDMAIQLQEEKIKPDLIITSNAVRALHTAEIFAEELGFSPKKIKVDPHIYSGGVDELVQIIKGIDSKFKSVFFFGHNPSLTLLAHLLCEGLRINISTCGILAMSFKMTDWEKVVESDGKFISYFQPHHEHPEYHHEPYP